MKALFWSLSFMFLAPTAFAAESADGTGPAPASVETPASRHDRNLPGGLSHNCLGSLCAENLGSLTSDRVTVTVDGLAREK